VYAFALNRTPILKTFTADRVMFLQEPTGTLMPVGASQFKEHFGIATAREIASHLRCGGW
jgi:hypothetical protein